HVGEVFPLDEDRLVESDDGDRHGKRDGKEKLARLADGAHAASLRAPVAAPTISSALHWPRRNSSTMRPSFMTMMRSASPITSGNSAEISTTASPSSASSPMTSWTAALEPISMPLVGSSRT